MVGNTYTNGMACPLRLASLVMLFAALCAWAAPAYAGRIEAGTFTAADTFGAGSAPTRVTFQQPFDEAPIVIVLTSTSGNNSATVQITNVTTTGFNELILEPDNWDGPHVAMITYYIAVEPGRHVLPDGTVIEAGRTTLTNVQFGSGFTGGARSWDNISFARPLKATPLVLHNLQTANSETRNVPSQSSRPHITSIAQNPSITGFQLAMDRSQANSGPFPSSETIGWIAFPTGLNGSFPDLNGTTINWSTRTTPANIRGWDNGCFGNSHGLTGASNPIVIAKKITRNNDDGGWFRYCSVNGSTINLRVDEDRDQDNERSIATGDAESAAIIAFSQSFHANLRADLGVTKVRTGITNSDGSQFGLPGATVNYLITVSNTGNSPPNENSVVVTEELPPQLDLLLADLGGAGTGPIDFDEGSPASSLICVFVTLTDPNDCVSFSTDGIDFSLEPEDNGEGIDPDIRFVRLRPTGFMNPNAGSGPPRFTLRLRARIR